MVKDYYIWSKPTRESPTDGNYTVAEAHHPMLAAASEAHSQAFSAFCSQSDFNFPSSQDYVEICLVVSEWPDGRDAKEYWFRVDTQMVELTGGE